MRKNQSILLWLAILVSLFPVGALAQGSGISSQVINTFGLPASNALVRVCPISSTGTPCTPVAPLFADPGLTVPISNPHATDQYGNYSVFVNPAASNYYLVQITPSSGIVYSYVVSSALGSGGGVNISSTAKPIGYYATPGAQISPASTFSFDPSLNQVNNPNAVNKLPRADVRHPDFGTPSGCANPADPTATNDSTCAIQAAISYANSIGLSSTVGSYPIVYIPYGRYKISSALRLPWQIRLQCDATAATNIIQYNNTANGITIYEPNNGANTDLFVLSGGIDNCGITSNGGHLHTGTLLEIDAGIGTKFSNLDIFNSGGRGIVMRSSPERMFFYNTVLSDIRFSWIGMGNNETQVLDTIINSSGIADGGSYCYGPNCVNGQTVNNSWNGTMNLIAASADGANPSTATFVITCSGNCVVDSNNVSQPYLSPIGVGFYFQVAGIPDVTALNGIWKSVTVSNNTPAGSFTVTAQLITGQFTYGPDEMMKLLNPTPVVASGASSNLTAATWKPMIWAQGNPAVLWEGDTTKWDRASIKLTSNSQCFQVLSPANTKITGFYCEGFPVNSQPRLNPDVSAFGYLPYTDLTSPFTCTPATGAPCPMSVFNDDWFPNYTNDPADAANPAIANTTIQMSMVPCDYNPASSAQSACAPTGVLQNQYEFMNLTFTQGKQAFVFTRNMAGSTAHNVAWPVGSHIGWNTATGVSNAGGANNLHLIDNHLESMNDGSGNTGMPNHGYGEGCNDNGPNICGTIINGRTPDYVMVFPVGTVGQTTPHVNIDVENSTLGGATPANETLGIGVIKVQGGGGVVIKGTDGLLPQAGETSGVLKGSTYNTSVPVVGIIYTNFSDGSVFSTSGVDVQDAVTDTTLHAESNQPTRGWYETKMTTTPSVAITGQGPNVAYGFGRQYTNADCFWDVGATHSQNQTCLQGGPSNSGANGGIFHSIWNGTAYKTTFSTNDNGQLTQGSTVIATSTLTFGTPQIRFNFAYWNGTAAAVANVVTTGIPDSSTVTPTTFAWTDQIAAPGLTVTRDMSAYASLKLPANTSVGSGSLVTGASTTVVNGISYYSNTTRLQAEITPNITTTPCFFQQVGNGTAAFAPTCGSVSSSLFNNGGGTVSNPHNVLGNGSLAGGSLSVTLSGSAAYTSASSYVCSANDGTTAAAVSIAYVSGTSFTITGTGTDAVRYQCIGN